MTRALFSYADVLIGHRWVAVVKRHYGRTISREFPGQVLTEHMQVHRVVASLSRYGPSTILIDHPLSRLFDVRTLRDW